jgi:hypothetical protein
VLLAVVGVGVSVLLGKVVGFSVGNGVADSIGEGTDTGVKAQDVAVIVSNMDIPTRVSNPELNMDKISSFPSYNIA